MGRGKVDRLMKQFVTDACAALKSYDNFLYRNLRNSDERVREFYEEDEWKGLGVWGITEPIIRFLISSALCRKYRIWPEHKYPGRTRRRADLTLYFEDSDFDGESIPDITIEMKWGGLRRRYDPGSLNRWSVTALQEDIRKLNALSRSPHNYVLQVGFAPEHITPGRAELNRQLRAELDGRTTRHLRIDLLDLQCFETHGADIRKRDWRCWLLCWKIGQRKPPRRSR